MTETTQVDNTGNRFVSRFAFLIALIVILIVVNLLYQPASNWNTVQTGDPSELIYSAGFDGFTDEWQQFDGRRLAQIQDGVLQLALEIPDTIYSASSPIYEDFDVSVTMRSIEGELTNDGYGVIFRLDENNTSGSCSRQFVIVCNLEQLPLLDTAIGLIAPAPQTQANGYYLFLISNDGYYQILRGNNETDLVEEVTIWHYSNGLLNEGIGAENRIRIVGQGNQFMFFLNGDPALLCVPLEGQQPTGNSDDCLGEETFIWEDNSFAQGKLGVVLNGATMAGDIIEFDNFTVTIPDEIIVESNNASTTPQQPMEFAVSLSHRVWLVDSNPPTHKLARVFKPFKCFTQVRNSPQQTSFACNLIHSVSYDTTACDYQIVSLSLNHYSTSTIAECLEAQLL